MSLVLSIKNNKHTFEREKLHLFPATNLNDIAAWLIPSVEDSEPSVWVGAGRHVSTFLHQSLQVHILCVLVGSIQHLLHALLRAARVGHQARAACVGVRGRALLLIGSAHIIIISAYGLFLLFLVFHFRS